MFEWLDIDLSQFAADQFQLDRYDYPFIKSVLSGNNGHLYVDNIKSPSTVHVHLGVYHFLTGIFSEQATLAMLDKIHSRGFIISDNNDWLDFLVRHLPNNASTKERVSMKYSGESYEYYQSILNTLPTKYSIKKIDDTLADRISQDWCKRLFIGFDTVDEFISRGIGYCILYNNAIASGVTSFSIMPDGIEFQLMTHRDFENQHLAQIVSSKLLQYCIENKMIPYWEAANEASKHIAEKLGFVESSSYKSVLIDFEK